MTKQIDIKELIPFMKDGWVAMEEDERWFWYDEMPFIEDEMWVFEGSSCASLNAFNIAPANDWTKSLIRINESQNNLCITDDTPHTESTVLFLDLLENKDENHNL